MKKTISALIIGLVCATSSSLVNAEDLLSVYNLAKASDPTVLKSRALFNASKEDIDQARATLLPQVNATGNFTKSENDVDGLPSPYSKSEIKKHRLSPMISSSLLLASRRTSNI